MSAYNLSVPGILLTLAAMAALVCTQDLCAQDQGANGLEVPPRSQLVRQELIGPADTLSVSVLGSEELSKTWRVDSSGRVNLPMVGTMEAAGKSPAVFQEELKTLLKKYYLDPQVLVYVSDTRSRPVTITGAVEHPGVYQLQETRSLAQVLLLASGPKDPGPTITISRSALNGVLGDARARREGDNQILDLPLIEVVSGHGPAAEIQIIPNDVISVSTVKNQKMVQVTGDVNRPGAIELVSHDAISLIEALGMAGGMTKTAKPKNTVILHVDSTGNSTPEHIDVRKVMNGKLSGIMLHSGDVVVVPTNGVTAFLQAASMSAVTTGMYLLGKF